MLADFSQLDPQLNPIAEMPAIQCLILDDSIFDQRRIARALKRTALNVETYEVASLDAFSAALQFGKYDVLFVDFRLPEGSGFDALKTLARTANGQRPKVIWVTGDVSYDWQKLHNVIGADAFIDKQNVSDYDFKELILKVLNVSNTPEGSGHSPKPEFKTV